MCSGRVVRRGRLVRVKWMWAWMASASSSAGGASSRVRLAVTSRSRQLSPLAAPPPAGRTAPSIFHLGDDAVLLGQGRNRKANLFQVRCADAPVADRGGAERFDFRSRCLCIACNAQKLGQNQIRTHSHSYEIVGVDWVDAKVVAVDF